MIGRSRVALRSSLGLRVVFFSLFLAPLLVLVVRSPADTEALPSWSWLAIAPLGRQGTARDDIMTTPVRQVLPQHILPTKYELTLEPNLDTFTFSGELKLHADVREATAQLQLNSEELDIHSVVSDAGAGKISYQRDLESVTFDFPAALSPGPSVLTIRYTGILNDKLKGFYRSKVKINGVERYMACTQMEPVDARRVLPCWDEPAVKAVFGVTLKVDAGLTALSNMPVSREEPVDGGAKKLVTFSDTPLMSSYLLAMVVGEFDFVEGRTADAGVLVRVYTPPGKGEQGRFALDVALKTLPFYNKYFGTPYPLPKCDMVAIADFAAGAMENWGLVTYRETALLVDAKSSSASHKQWVALVVGHELAHQWFGNLVTMEWWDGLWLNEGFASWVEYLCVDHCFPDWKIWTQFVYLDVGRAFELDALASSHPVEVPVYKACDVDEVFDAISYSKGCAVIRMLQGWLGAEPFRRGLVQYLDAFKYRNAVTSDLWNALGAASGNPNVARVMDSWIKQTGYPVLLVEETTAPQGATGQRTLKLSQRRFLQGGGSAQEGPQLWSLPLSWVTASTSTPTAPHIVDAAEQSVTVAAAAGDWIKLNYDQTGFYRVLYPPHMLAALRSAIEKGALGATDRLGLANDVLSLCQAGHIDAATALSFIGAYAAERDYTVWADLTSKLSEIDTLLSNSADAYPHFERFGLKLFSPVAHHLGWDARADEHHTTPMLRALALGRAARYGDAAVVEEARKRFARFLADPTSLSPDLRSAVYATVLRASGADATVFDQLVALYRTSDTQEEKTRVLGALGAASDAALLQRALEFALSSDVRSQDAVTLIGGVAANRFGRQLAWSFVQARWAQLAKMYEGGFLLTRLMKSATGFASEDKALEVADFHAKNPVPGSDRTVKQTVEAIRLNAQWLNRDEKTLLAWLSKM